MKLEVRNGSFGYRSRSIIDGLDLAVPENAVLTILGPNGAGKTTLLKCMMGFLHWNRGDTYIDGRPSRKACARWRRSRRGEENLRRGEALRFEAAPRDRDASGLEVAPG